MPAVCFLRPNPYASTGPEKGESGHANAWSHFVRAVRVDAGSGGGRREPTRPFVHRNEGFKLVYFDSLDYLVPHAVRTFTNSLAWQRRIFGWVPSEPSDRPAAGFLGLRQRRPIRLRRTTGSFSKSRRISHAFETFPATERMYSLMNHEMVHMAAGDMASEEDRRWRRFFLGKVSPQPQNPESLLYSYLTIPRFNAPRWYNEGGAVFLETWMGGGLGRAQGGYDEMVFRAMVRDNAHFYDPLGLASRASASISRPARMHTSTARGFSRTSPTSIRRKRSSHGSSATREANATTPTNFSRYSAFRSNRPGRTGSPSSTNSSGATWPKFASFRLLRSETWPRSRSGRYRGCTTTSRPAPSMPASATPAWSITSAR